MSPGHPVWMSCVHTDAIDIMHIHMWIMNICMHVFNTHGSYRRLLAMFGEVVLGLEAGAFEAQMDLVREEVGVDDDSMLTGEDMKVIVGRFKVSQY